MNFVTFDDVVDVVVGNNCFLTILKCSQVKSENI